MDSLTLKEASEKWGVPPRRVNYDIKDVGKSRDLRFIS